MREVIANRQLLFLLFVMRSTVIIAYLPVLTSADALQDAWLSAVFAFAGTLILVLAISFLGSRFPEKTLVEYSQELLGSVGGRAVSLILLGVYLLLAAIDIRLYSEVLLMSFLPETPISFITAVMVLASATAVYFGLEVMGRLADLIMPLFLLFVVISLLLPLLEFEFGLLFPVMGRGVWPAIRGSIAPIGVGAQYLVLAMMQPAVNEPEKAVRTSAWAVAGPSMLLVLAAVVVVGVLGAPQGADSIFPVFRMIRAVRISEIVPHMEPLAVVAWGFGLFSTVAIFLYSGARGLSQVMSLQDYRPLILPMSLIWAVLSIHAFENLLTLSKFLSPQILGVWGLSVVIVPYSVLYAAYGIRALLERIRGDSHDR